MINLRKISPEKEKKKNIEPYNYILKPQHYLPLVLGASLLLIVLMPSMRCFFVDRCKETRRTTFVLWKISHFSSLVGPEERWRHSL